ncbi:MAG: Gfo/Idh/MocA family protein, partial [Alphaproteobacteria bacterium]
LQHRARPSALSLRKFLAENNLGPLRACEISIPWWRPQSYYDEPGRGTYARDGGGVLISQAIHTLDLALSFTGPAEEVTALTATTGLHQMESEDFVSAGLTFPGGTVGMLFATTACYPGNSEFIRLHFSEVTAHLESNLMSLAWHDGREEIFGEATASGSGADPMAFTSDWHMAIVDDFADCLETGKPPIVPGREALHVHRLIEALEKSGREGKRVRVNT